MLELLKKYDRSLVFIFTIIVGIFGAYHIFKNVVKDVNDMKPKVRSLEEIVIRHDEMIKTVKEGQREMSGDIKAILRALK